MALKLKNTNDAIIYTCNGMFSTSKEKLEISLNMNDHYSGKHTQRDIKAEVLETQKVFDELKAKLTSKELFLLNVFCKIV